MGRIEQERQPCGQLNDRRTVTGFGSSRLDTPSIFDDIFGGD